MGKITLYGIDGSPPVRSVLLTLKALNLPFEYKVVNLLAGEHMTPEFLKMNPLHTVPTLDDNGFYIGDSHAINAYLVSKYGKTDILYPQELQYRAIVDQRLFYNASVALPSLRAILKQVLFLNELNIPKEKIDALAEVYTTLELYLKDQTYVAGNMQTIADFHFISVITTATVFLEVDRSTYPKLAAWLERAKSLPYYEEANGKGVAGIIGLIKSKDPKIV
ncbi:glutathione S-transferase 1-like [Scaptodrosophila lebanonensis]|uniref:Glutathione S-transferase 1-like n=1 Tax=Drosophila lebanonensis TaxID=7225 RepID=A0A6J2U946_DROLE|nr:glutathione S-transferase 1-like [Scaptodrosophila lebanonensis]